MTPVFSWLHLVNHGAKWRGCSRWITRPPLLPSLNLIIRWKMRPFGSLWCLLVTATCCCLLLPAWLAGAGCCRLLLLLAAAGYCCLLLSARHNFRNTSGAGKRHLISCQPYSKIESCCLLRTACCCLLVPTRACCWLLPAFDSYPCVTRLEPPKKVYPRHLWKWYFNKNVNFLGGPEFIPSESRCWSPFKISTIWRFPKMGVPPNHPF